MTQLTKMPVNGRAVHFCPICTAAYTSREEALECSASTPVPEHVPGDIVVWRSLYTWMDGAAHWRAKVRKKGSLHNDQDAFDFYMVVTAVGVYADVDSVSAYSTLFNANPQGRHKPVYHVRTLGLKNGNPDGFCGWTGMNHVRMRKILPRWVPPRVLEESKALVGQRFDHLL